LAHPFLENNEFFERMCQVASTAEELGPVLAPVVADAYLLNAAIEGLRAYSLIARDPHAQTLAVHRLVQAGMPSRMPVEAQRQWMQRAVHAVAEAFPESPDFAKWPIAECLLPHALI
jgi:hypothetical protein